MSAVLFDLDGTLVDSRPGIVAAMNQTLRAEGAAPRTEAELVARIGPPLHETLSGLLGRPVDTVDAVVAAYRKRYATTMLTGTHAYPGIPALLDALRADGRPLAVATSKSQPLARALLEHLGLAAPFAVVCGPVPPSREGKAGTIARALAALGVDDAVMIGDRHHDIGGGLAHGLRVLGVAWGYAQPDELQDAGAEAVAADAAQLAALLGVALAPAGGAARPQAPGGTASGAAGADPAAELLGPDGAP